MIRRKRLQDQHGVVHVFLYELHCLVCEFDAQRPGLINLTDTNQTPTCLRCINLAFRYGLS